MSLAATLITERSELGPLRSEWNALLEKSSADTIFLTWDWVDAWLDAVFPAPELLVITLRDADGRLAAVAPLYVDRLRLLGVVNFRCLRVLGDQYSGSEYPDIIVRPGLEVAALRRVFEVLQDQRAAWECVWLKNLAGWTGAHERIAETAAAMGISIRSRSRDFSAMCLPATYDDFLKSLTTKARTNIRRRDKLLAAEHAVSFERCERADQLPEFLGALFDLHGERWGRDGQAGSFRRKPLMRRFYETMSEVALRHGWLRLCALKLDGRIRAAQFGYAYHGKFYSMQEGYDPAAPSGVGNVLRNQVIQASIAEGLREYDFLGGTSENKRNWGAAVRTGYDVLLGRRSLKTNLLFARDVWPTGRFLKESSRVPAAT